MADNLNVINVGKDDTLEGRIMIVDYPSILGNYHKTSKARKTVVIGSPIKSVGAEMAKRLEAIRVNKDMHAIECTCKRSLESKAFMLCDGDCDH